MKIFSEEIMTYRTYRVCYSFSEGRVDLVEVHSTIHEDASREFQKKYFIHLHAPDDLVTILSYD